MATSDRSLLEEKLLLMEALAERRASDPLYTFEPHAKQRPFIQAVLGDECYENHFVAANRSGKTDAGAYCAAKLAREGIEPVRSSYAAGGRIEIRDRATSGWVVSLDFPASRDIVQPKLFDNGYAVGQAHPPFIPEREYRKEDWSVSNQVLRLKNGSIIGFKSCEAGRKKFQGKGLDWLWFDEEPPIEIYSECLIRVEGGRRLRVFLTATLLPPEGQVGGVTWVFTDIIQPFVNHQRMDVQVFGASIYDNPSLALEELSRLEAKYPAGSIERRIRLDGEWLPGLSGARAYQAFHRGLHVRPQTTPLPRLPLCWFWDFNVEPMVSGIGQRVNLMFHVYREFVMEEGNIPGMVDLFKAAYPSHNAELWIYGDATGEGRTGQTGKTDYQIIANNLRDYPAPYRLKVPESNPFQPDRINAMNVALRNEGGAIGMEIDPSCVELIADLEQVLRDPRGGILKTRNRRDPYFRRTHLSDALGYWVWSEAPVKSNVRRGKVGTPQQKNLWVPGYSFARN